MGIEQAVILTSNSAPSWRAVRDFLGQRGFPVELRMIDRELAFPDEVPADSWRELRIGTAAGMVTVHREPERLRFVTWGNADRSLREAWNVITWAFADVTGGNVQTGEQTISPSEFAHKTEMPGALGPG